MQGAEQRLNDGSLVEDGLPEVRVGESGEQVLEETERQDLSVVDNVGFQRKTLFHQIDDRTKPETDSVRFV
jgi:hypothetical protein